jgi:uroporphyrinogen-III synthase
MSTARPLVVVLSAPETLTGVEAAVSRHRLQVRRVSALRLRPHPNTVPSAERVRRARIDTVIVTSAHGAGPALAAWCRSPGRRAPPEVWTAGPESTARLRRAGYRRVRRTGELGADKIVRRLGRSPRRIVRLRSNLAGLALTRALRAGGHRVTDVVTYRVEPAVGELRRARPLFRRAAALVASSPSVVSALRKALGDAAVRRLGATTPVVVLGERSAAAATRAGFRRVRVASSTSPQRFARLLVRTVNDAAA